jgi:hypothetical protein
MQCPYFVETSNKQSKYSVRRVLKSRAIRRTEQIGVAVALQTCIRKVLGLNIDSDTGCPD